MDDADECVHAIAPAAASIHDFEASLEMQAEGYKLDADHFHQAVHGSIDYARHLKPDLELRELLLSIQLPRVVFTNADRAHAERCLELMGIADCFEVCCPESRYSSRTGPVVS